MDETAGKEGKVGVKGKLVQSERRTYKGICQERKRG